MGKSTTGTSLCCSSHSRPSNGTISPIAMPVYPENRKSVEVKNTVNDASIKNRSFSGLLYTAVHAAIKII